MKITVNPNNIEAKLLGTILTDDLKWNRNTENIVRETNRRMQLLHKAKKFTNNSRDLKQIYITTGIQCTTGGTKIYIA